MNRLNTILARTRYSQKHICWAAIENPDDFCSGRRYLGGSRYSAEYFAKIWGGNSRVIRVVETSAKRKNKT